MQPLQGVLGYLLLPVAATLIGGAVATWRTPGPRVQSAIQHFAAGVVFAAVAGEILPEIRHERAPIPIILGFSAGVIAMLGIRYVTERLWKEASATGDKESPTSLLITVGVDLFLDGLLVGIGFAAGSENGILLAIALTLEVLFLGLATAAALLKGGAGRGRVIGTTAALASVVALGAIIGVTLLAGLSGTALEIALSFGAAALLYLVTEELLTEAHEVPETPLITAMFFLGFLALFLIELLTPAAS